HQEWTSWYGTHHYILKIQDTIGEQVLTTHTIEADRPVGIHFLGDNEGGVTVTSNGTGKVLLEGSILNPSGTTTIHGNSSVESLSDSSIVSGKRIVIDAGTGVGTAARALQTN